MRIHGTRVAASQRSVLLNCSDSPQVRSPAIGKVACYGSLGIPWLFRLQRLRLLLFLGLQGFVWLYDLWLSSTWASFTVTKEVKATYTPPAEAQPVEQEAPVVMGTIVAAGMHFGRHMHARMGNRACV